MRLRLELEVDYTIPDTVPIEDIIDRLKFVAKHAVMVGLLTGDTDATVNTWKADVVNPAHIVDNRWTRHDVVDLARERGFFIDDRLAEEIVDILGRKLDASIGINWDVIESHLEDNLQCCVFFAVSVPEGSNRDILNEETIRYWSIDHEWSASFESARKFTFKEAREYNLPMDDFSLEQLWRVTV